MNLRVFLSSPGDVADERNLARKVLRKLEKERAFTGKIDLVEVSWDDPDAFIPLDAQLTPQEAINRKLPKPSECDVVVVILWSRMGTPLPREYSKPDGTPYRSGTEYEFFDAIAGADKTGKPSVWVYRRDEELKVGAKDPQRDETLRQVEAVEAFFAEFRDETGAIRRTSFPYTSPSQFQNLFEGHLRDRISQLLEDISLQPVIAPGSPEPALSRGDAPSELWQGNPYRGLAPFGPNDTAIFFGRGLETDELVKGIREGIRVLAVIGASGSGKSSLAAAGLLPRLTAGAIRGSAHWLQVRFTSAEQGDNPFLALALALFPHLAGTDLSVDTLADHVAKEPAYIEKLAGQALAGKPSSAQLLLFADQFEELFTARVAEVYRAPFIKLVDAIAESSRVRLILTLRADYYEHCTRFETLAARLREGSFPLAAPTGRALAEMIERPALAAGLDLEPGLVDDILRDVGAEPGRLALMEFTLEQLYRLSSKGVLSRKDYAVELKGVAGAISRQADKAIRDEAGNVDEASLATAFDALSEVDETGGAVRRRAWLDAMPPDVQAVVQRLITARLLTSDRDPETGRPWVEVAHESVLREWPRFSQWLEDYGAFKLWRKRLNEARDQWLKKGRDSGELLTGTRLKEALIKRKEQPAFLTADENDFIRRSQVHRWGTGITLSAAVMALPLLVGIYFWWIDGEQLTHKAAYNLALAHLGFWRVLEPEMVIIPPDRDCSPKQPCSFGMGSNPVDCAKAKDQDQDQGECPQHQVTFRRPFKMGKYEVKFDEYEVFRHMIERDGGCRDGHKIPENHAKDSGFGRGERPVINVSWEDAQCYADWLSGKTGHKYRLPTEAEWEYAARAGTSTDYFWGESEDQGNDYAWAPGNSDSMTHPVGQKGPNGFGLYDMAGNVWEWVEDCWHKTYDCAPTDGGAWNQREEGQEKECGKRVIRGGSWMNEPTLLRSATRSRFLPDSRHSYLGFRLAQDL